MAGLHKNFSLESRREKDGEYNDHASPHSHDPIKNQNESLDKEEWRKFISYYRKYPDKFAIEVLGLKIFLFQRLVLRAMARNQYVMLIMCRGLGKKLPT